MKLWLKARMADAGLHGYTSASLPTGVDWLHDIRRQVGGVGESPLCLDVGANIGQTVLQLRQAWPGARIHAFEPFAAPYRELAALCRGLEGTQAWPLALGAQAGEVAVAPRAQSVLNSLRTNTHTNADGNGHAHEHGPASEGGPVERIRIETVDGHCRAQHIDRIDVLKTDTEGYDLEVLRGAEEMLSSGRIGFVYTEVTFHPANTQNSPFQPIFEHLTARGYRFLGLYETYPLHHFAEPNLFCNALFMTRRSTPLQ